MAHETLYSSETKVRIEPAVKAAVWTAARSLGTKPAEYIRMALREPNADFDALPNVRYWG
jgi:hypothetical protein